MRIVCFIGILLAATPTFAQRSGGGQNPPLVCLKTVTEPAPTGLDRYVQDQTALVVQNRGVRS